jgi:hypothetical protein
MGRCDWSSKMSIETKNIVKECVRVARKQLTPKIQRGSRQLNRKVLMEPATLDEILSGVVSLLGCELPDEGRFECENTVFKDHAYTIHDFYLIKVRYKVLTVEGYYSTFYETDIYLSDDELRLFGSEGFDYFVTLWNGSDGYVNALTKEGESALESIFTKLVRIYQNILSYIENESLERGRTLLLKRPVTKNVRYSPRAEVIPTSELILATLVEASCSGLLVGLEGGGLLKANWECLAGIEG